MMFLAAVLVAIALPASCAECDATLRSDASALTLSPCDGAGEVVVDGSLSVSSTLTASDALIAGHNVSALVAEYNALKAKIESFLPPSSPCLLSPCGPDNTTCTDTTANPLGFQCSCGGLCWGSKFVVADVRADLANSVAADSQGNYFLGVAGQPLLVDPYDGFIIKTDSAGNFVSQYDVAKSLSTSYTSVVHMAVNADDDLFVALQLNNGLSVQRFHNNLTRVWSFESSFSGGGRSLCLLPNGDVMCVSVASSSDSEFGGNDQRVSRLNGATGAHMWTKDYGGSGTDGLHAIICLDNDEFISIGYTDGVMGSSSGGSWDGTVLRGNASDGTVLAVKQSQGLGFDEYTSGTRDPVSGVIYVTGKTDGALPTQSHQGSQWDTFVVAYSADLSTVVNVRQIGTSFSYIGRSILYSLGHLYVGGSRTEVSFRNAFVLDLSPSTLADVNTAVFASTDDDDIHAMAVDPTGALLVTGGISGVYNGVDVSHGQDVLFAKYSWS